MIADPMAGPDAGAPVECQLLVLGGGSAGHAAASRAAKLGVDTVLVDGSEPLGGLCILQGCMPSKALIESANRHRLMDRCGGFGVASAEPRFDMSRAQHRKRHLIDGFRRWRAGQMTAGEYRLVRGKGRFVAPHRLWVSSRNSRIAVRARASVIATGSAPRIPELDGLEESGYWTSPDVLGLRELPDSVIILGAGAVGMEMAHFFEGAGCRVTILQRSKLPLPALDRDIGTEITEISRSRGIDLRTGFEARRVVKTKAGIEVVGDWDGRKAKVSAAALLAATGRRPVTTGIGLEEAGVVLDHDGRLMIDEHACTPVRGVFAAGDVASPHAVVHLAVRQGEIAAEEAARELGNYRGPRRSWRPELAMHGIFTEPEVVALGHDQATARALGFDPIAARAELEEHGKAMLIGATEGFVKLIADRPSGRLLGAAAVGRGMVDLAHEVMVAIAAGMTAVEFADVPHYHPTMAEVWTEPAHELAERCGTQE